MQSYDYLIWQPSDYIAHHGIKGQEWGKKNGPPYPLDKSEYSRKEKASDIDGFTTRKIKKIATRAVKGDLNDSRNRAAIHQSASVTQKQNAEKFKAKADKYERKNKKIRAAGYKAIASEEEMRSTANAKAATAYFSQSKALDTLLSDMENDTIKAGQDYVARSLYGLTFFGSFARFDTYNITNEDYLKSKNKNKKDSSISSRPKSSIARLYFSR